MYVWKGQLIFFCHDASVHKVYEIPKVNILGKFQKGTIKKLQELQDEKLLITSPTCGSSGQILQKLKFFH